MFWFKNAMIYRITQPLNWHSDELQTNLTNQAYFPCSQHDMSKFGWAAPLQESELLHFSVNQQILLVAHREEKILPSSVIMQNLQERITEIESQQDRKLKKVERLSLKDDVVATLLPRAFSKNQQTAVWIDTVNNLIYIDTASAKRAEDALALLRKSLGSLPVKPLSFANQPTLIMTDWLTHDNLPNWLNYDDEAELKAADESGIIRCKQQALDSDEIIAHLRAGKFATKLALEWEEHLRFVLAEDGSLKRIKYMDIIREQNADIPKEDFPQRFDADFVLMSGIISKLIKNLLDEFGGEENSENTTQAES